MPNSCVGVLLAALLLIWGESILNDGKKEIYQSHGGIAVVKGLG